MHLRTYPKSTDCFEAAVAAIHDQNFQRPSKPGDQAETLTCIVEEGPAQGQMEFVFSEGQRVRSNITGAFTLSLAAHHSALLSLDMSGSQVNIDRCSSGYLSLTLDLRAPAIGSVDRQGHFRTGFWVILSTYDGSQKPTSTSKFEFPATLSGICHRENLTGKITGTLPAAVPLLGKSTLNMVLHCSTIRWSSSAINGG